MKQSRLISFTKYFLDFMFISGIIVEISLPFTMRVLGRYFWKEPEKMYWPMMIIFGISGICGLIIVFQLRKMIKSVVKRECFVDDNTKSLSMMGKVSFVIAALFAAETFFFPTPASLVIVLTFFIAGIFSLVLSLVFAEAVRFKEENDLTI